MTLEEKIGIFELTVPPELNLQNANTQNMKKYENFLTDKTARDFVHPFKIGSRKYISPSNKANLK